MASNSSIGSHAANQRLVGLDERTSAVTGTPRPSLHLFPLVWMGDSYLGIIFDGSAHIAYTVTRSVSRPLILWKQCPLWTRIICYHIQGRYRVQIVCGYVNCGSFTFTEHWFWARSQKSLACTEQVFSLPNLSPSCWWIISLNWVLTLTGSACFFADTPSSRLRDVTKRKLNQEKRRQEKIHNKKEKSRSPNWRRPDMARWNVGLT